MGDNSPQFMPADVFFQQHQLADTDTREVAPAHFKRASLMQLQQSNAVRNRIGMFEQPKIAATEGSVAQPTRMLLSKTGVLPSLKEDDESDLISSAVDAQPKSKAPASLLSFSRPETSVFRRVSGGPYGPQQMGGALATAAAAIARLKAKEQPAVVSEAVSIDNMGRNSIDPKDADEVTSPVKQPAAAHIAVVEKTQPNAYNSPEPTRRASYMEPLPVADTPQSMRKVPSAPNNTPAQGIDADDSTRSPLQGLSQGVLAASAVQAAFKQAAAAVSPSQVINSPASAVKPLLAARMSMGIGSPEQPEEHSSPAAVFRANENGLSAQFEADPSTPTDAPALSGVSSPATQLDTVNQRQNNAGVTPFTAKTVYDGDDVVMGDAYFGAEDAQSQGGTPVSSSPMQLNTGRPSSVNASRFKLEAERQNAAAARTPPMAAAPQQVMEVPVVAHVTTHESKKRVSFGVDPTAATDVAPVEAEENSKSRRSSMYSVRPPTPLPPKMGELLEEEEDVSSESQGEAFNVPEKAAMSPAVSFNANPLASTADVVVPVQPDTAPVAVDSPAMSHANSGAISNNPLFASSPAHPTPASVSMAPRSLTGRLSTLSLTPPASLAVTPAAGGGSPGAVSSAGSPGGSGSSTASKGLQLADRLHAVAEFLVSPGVGVAPVSARKMNTTPVVAKEHGSNGLAAGFEFSNDIANVIAALEAATPMPAMQSSKYNSMKEAAAASTVKRPQRRSLPGASAELLDLAGFDLDGDRRTPSMGTPTVNAPGSMGMSGASNTTAAVSVANATTAIGMATTADVGEIKAMRREIAELKAERDEATSLLASYQGSIKELQDRHSEVMIKLQAEMAVMKSQNDKLEAERQSLDQQFSTLYHEKYQPLKAEAAALRQGTELMRARLNDEQKKNQDTESLRLELAAARQGVKREEEAAAAAKAEAAAAREAERLAEKRAAEANASLAEKERVWASKAQAETQRAQHALAAKHTELEQLRSRHDEAVHRANLAKAKNERKDAEVARKEEEVCNLQVEVQELSAVLQRYKEENGKFAAVKENYKRRIASLEAEVHTKHNEKQAVVDMCSELMAKLEQHGILLDPSK